MTCAGLNALGPRIVELFVRSVVTTLHEPSTAANTATALAVFVVDAAFGAFWDH